MEKTKEIDIINIFLLLTKHKKFIFTTTLIVSIAAVLYVMIVPQYWVSTSTILPADSSDNGSIPFNSSSLFGLGSSLLGGSLNSSRIDLVTIMKSRTFSEDVINRFNLVEYMEIEDPDILVVKELALMSFNENIRNINLNEETGVISISIETKDKFLSTDIANYYWQRLEKYNLETRMSKGKQKRVFLEGRVKEVQTTIDSLSQELLKFQRENNVVLLEEQTSAIVQMYSDLIAEQTQKELELEFAEIFTSSHNPNIEKLKHENSILNDKISDMESLESDSNYKYLLSLDSIPDKAIEFANLKMNLKIQEQIYSFVYPQYEQAKIEEIKDLPTIEVIDKATPAGLRSKPKRAKFCIISFVLAIFFSSIFSLSIDKIKYYFREFKLRSRA